MIKSYNFSIYKYKSKLLRAKYKLQLNSYKELEKSQNNLRKIYHDINNHNAIIYNLLSNKEYDKAFDYLKQFNNDLKAYDSILFTNHKILNAIFINKVDICKNNNIDFDLDIKIPSELSISDFDLCILVGNLLDNAIEACCKLNTNKYIKIKAKIINDNFIFKIENSFDGNLNIDNGRFLTYKSDTLNHGFGIYNVKSVVSKLNGNYNFNFSNSEFYVIITIPL